MQKHKSKRKNQGLRCACPAVSILAVCDGHYISASWGQVMGEQTGKNKGQKAKVKSEDDL
jgi:hypothetical protein